jgi:serine/threonine protein phosphatase PrpC
MALRVAEQSYRTDTGRQRTANEDSYFARSPLFAVADGMGGAQAGEVASRMAAEAFEPAERRGESPESFLRTIAEQANRQIHSLAQHDASRSGMGTTLTSALLDGDDVAIGHVGDSRAYRLRDGELSLLTSDHSLVEELRRQGRLTDEQAEEHPQRSIITRALGPEPEVEVDTMTYSARPGDVYLICSDGLTTMIREERVRDILVESASLDEATERLVTEANEAGGRDNITVIAFRLEEGEAVEEPEPDATLVGPTAAAAGLSGERVRAEAAERERSRASLGGAASEPQRRRERPKPKRSRTALKVLAAAVIVAGVAVAAVLGARQIYFLGTDEGGRLALYRGLPYELPLDIALYSEVLSSPIQVESLPEDRRDEATDHELRSREDAEDLLDDLAQAARELTEPEPEPGGGNGDGGNRGNGGGGDGDNRAGGGNGGDRAGAQRGR